MSKPRISAVLATVMTAFALTLTLGLPTANADPLDEIKDTVNRDRAKAEDCYPYFYSPELEVIAQAYARSENPADVANGKYDGEKVGFLGSGDPQAAATTSAYKRGAGDMLGKCDWYSFGVGFVRHEDREVDVVTIVFGNPKEPDPKPEAKHEYNPVGPAPGPCPGANYKFAGNVIFDLEDFTKKNERGTVVTMPSATSDGKIAGQADGSLTGFDHGTGRADGQITGTNVDVTVVFAQGESGGIFNGITMHFEGFVLSNGGAGGAMTTSEGKSGGWHTRTTESVACKVADAAAVEAAPKTATVKKPVDISDGPDGTGTPYKNADGDNVFKPAGEVQLVAPDLCRKDWCHVVAPEVPGPAWIYAGEGFVTVP